MKVIFNGNKISFRNNFVVTYFKVPSRHLLGESMKAEKDLSDYRVTPPPPETPTPTSEYKFEALPLHPDRSVYCSKY